MKTELCGDRSLQIETRLSAQPFIMQTKYLLLFLIHKQSTDRSNQLPLFLKKCGYLQLPAISFNTSYTYLAYIAVDLFQFKLYKIFKFIFMKTVTVFNLIKVNFNIFFIILFSVETLNQLDIVECICL